MQLDDTTLMLALTMASAVGAGVVAAISKMGHSAPGTKCWAGALVLITLAFSTVLFFPQSGTLRGTFYNLFLLGGHTLWLCGTAQFVGLPFTRRKGLILFLSIAVITLMFTFVWPDRTIRLVVIGVWLMAIRILNAVTLWRGVEDDLHEQALARATAMVAGIEVLATFSYTYFAAVGELPYIGEQAGTVAAITWVGAFVGIIVGGPILVLLTVSRFIAELNQVALKDSLTGLLNRRGFVSLSEPILAKVIRDGQVVSVLMIDIDHFKRINDTYGHGVGDAVITGLGEAVKTCLRKSDIAARWGGEEVCILAQGADQPLALQLADRLMSRFQVTCRGIAGLEKENITLSIGICSATLKTHQEFTELQKDADKHLYLAKQKGRAQISY